MLRLHIGAGAVFMEDAARLRIAPDCTAVLQDALPPDREPVTRDWIRRAYKWPTPRYSDMVKVTPLTLFDAGLVDGPLMFEFARCQAGQLVYAVAALMIWVSTDTGKYVCENDGKPHT